MRPAVSIMAVAKRAITVAMIVTATFGITASTGYTQQQHPSDLELIARVVRVEAIGEPVFAKILVAASIRNRANVLKMHPVRVALDTSYWGADNKDAIDNPPPGKELDDARYAVRKVFSFESDRLGWVYSFHDYWAKPAWRLALERRAIIGGLYFYAGPWNVKWPVRIQRGLAH